MGAVFGHWNKSSHTHTHFVSAPENTLMDICTHADLTPNTHMHTPLDHKPYITLQRVTSRKKRIRSGLKVSM